MEFHVFHFAFLYFGIFSFIECNHVNATKGNFITNAIVSYFCGNPGNQKEVEPLRFSPWMVLLSYVTEKGKEGVFDCGATLVSGRLAITSDTCLKKHATLPVFAIVGAPNIEQFNRGTKRQIMRISYMLSQPQIAVIQFNYVGHYTNTITPICLERGDLVGTYATIGYNMGGGMRKYGKKLAYLKMLEYCKIDGFCAKVLPVEEIWEMDANEIQDGAPLLIKKGFHWYIKGIMVEKNIDGNKDDSNNEKGSTEKETDKDGSVTKEKNNKKRRKNNKKEQEKKFEERKAETEDDNKKKEDTENKDDKPVNENVEVSTTEKGNGAEEVPEDGQPKARKPREIDDKKYDLYFVKMNSYVVDELRGMFSLLK